MLRRKNRLFSCLLVVFILISSISTTTAFAMESTTDSSITVEGENNIQPYGSFTTFLNFKEGWQSGTQQYTFTLGKACVLKSMMNARYYDGSSGSVSVMIMNVNTSQIFTRTFNAPSTQTETKTFNGGNLVPAGTYNVLVTPSKNSPNYLALGLIYCMDY